MGTIDIAGLPIQDVLQFMDDLDAAVALLDTLAQLQACVGGLSMQGRARHTEEIGVRLQRIAKELRRRNDLLNR